MFQIGRLQRESRILYLAESAVDPRRIWVVEIAALPPLRYFVAGCANRVKNADALAQIGVTNLHRREDDLRVVKSALFCGAKFALRKSFITGKLLLTI